MSAGVAKDDGSSSKGLPAAATAEDTGKGVVVDMLVQVAQEIIYSPMNFVLVLIIAFLIYKIIRDRFDGQHDRRTEKPSQPELPRLRRDFTVAELKQYDGSQPDGRILIGVNGFVFDVTKAKHFYGAGAPYANFAGHNVTRNLATSSMVMNDSEEYDDLSDLTPMQMECVNEWEMQFREKYNLVGKLLRPGEQPTNYEDEEDDEEDADRELNKGNEQIPANITLLDQELDANNLIPLVSEKNKTQD